MSRLTEMARECSCCHTLGKVISKQTYFKVYDIFTLILFICFLPSPSHWEYVQKSQLLMEVFLVQSYSRKCSESPGRVCSREAGCMNHSETHCNFRNLMTTHVVWAIFLSNKEVIQVAFYMISRLFMSFVFCFFFMWTSQPLHNRGGWWKEEVVPCWMLSRCQSPC